MSTKSTPEAVSAVTLFEKAPYGIVVTDTGLKILVVNDAGLRFFVSGRAQLIGMPLFDLLLAAADSDNGWQQRLRQSYAQVLATGAQAALLLPLPAGLAGVSGTTLHASTAPVSASGLGIWQVCLIPLHNEDGALVAIASYMLLLEGVEMPDPDLTSLAPMQPALAGTVPGASIEFAGNGAAAGQSAAAQAAGMLASALSAPAGAGSHGAASEVAETAGAAFAGSRMRILMVEDNEDLRTINVDQLEILGHQVTSTADAEQALRHLETSTFDLLFTDLTLPKMTGAELARIVLQQHHPMQVVITSGYGRAMANAQSLDALFLPKPYRFADLQEVLRQVRLRRVP